MGWFGEREPERERERELQGWRRTILSPLTQFMADHSTLPLSLSSHLPYIPPLFLYRYVHTVSRATCVQKYIYIYILGVCKIGCIG